MEIESPPAGEPLIELRESCTLVTDNLGYELWVRGLTQNATLAIPFNVTNEGVIRLQSTNSNVRSSLNVTADLLTNDPAGVIEALDAEPAGLTDPSITGDIHNAGRFRVGAGVELSMTGTLSQVPGAVLNIELGGVDEADYSRLLINSTSVLALDGVLQVTLVNGHVPQPGEEYEFAVAGDVIGALEAISGPGDYEVSLRDNTNGTTSALLTVLRAPCPGDLTDDGNVDLADLSRMLTNYGTIAGAFYEDGDLDGDGDIDLSDLSTLLTAFGTSCP